MEGRAEVSEKSAYMSYVIQIGRHRSLFVRFTLYFDRYISNINVLICHLQAHDLKYGYWKLEMLQ